MPRPFGPKRAVGWLVRARARIPSCFSFFALCFSFSPQARCGYRAIGPNYRDRGGNTRPNEAWLSLHARLLQKLHWKAERRAGPRCSSTRGRVTLGDGHVRQRCTL